VKSKRFDSFHVADTKVYKFAGLAKTTLPSHCRGTDATN
jgi:hypothetical protein